VEHLRGILKILILKELEKENLSGKELIDRIGIKTAKKPSPGSVYPLLHELLDSGFLEVRVSGKRKIYSLSEHGRRVLEEYSEREKQAILSKIQVLKDWGVISSDEHDNLLEFVQMKRDSFLRLFGLRNWIKFVALLSKTAENSKEAAEKILENAICLIEEMEGRK